MLYAILLMNFRLIMQVLLQFQKAKTCLLYTSMFKSKESLTKAYKKLLDKQIIPIIDKGLYLSLIHIFKNAIADSATDNKAVKNAVKDSTSEATNVGLTNGSCLLYTSRCV